MHEKRKSISIDGMRSIFIPCEARRLGLLPRPGNSSSTRGKPRSGSACQIARTDGTQGRAVALSQRCMRARFHCGSGGNFHASALAVPESLPARPGAQSSRLDSNGCLGRAVCRACAPGKSQSTNSPLHGRTRFLSERIGAAGFPVRLQFSGDRAGQPSRTIHRDSATLPGGASLE